MARPGEIMIGTRVSVEIDSPRGSLAKRRDDGRVDFVSPLPTPYNYGSVPGTVASDGDRLDAIVLGPPLPRGTRVETTVRAVVRFVDAGADDRKLVCSDRPLRERERRGLVAFFTLYAPAKRALNRLRKQQGKTAFLGIDG